MGLGLGHRVGDSGLGCRVQGFQGFGLIFKGHLKEPFNELRSLCGVQPHPVNPNKPLNLVGGSGGLSKKGKEGGNYDRITPTNYIQPPEHNYNNPHIYRIHKGGIFHMFSGQRFYLDVHSLKIGVQSSIFGTTIPGLCQNRDRSIERGGYLLIRSEHLWG